MSIISSGPISASETLLGINGQLYGLQVLTDGTNDAEAVVYDETSATGLELWRQPVTGADKIGGFLLSIPGGIKFNTGLHITISGTGAKFNAYFKGG